MTYEFIPMTCAAAAAALFAIWTAFRLRAGLRRSAGSSLLLFAALTVAGSMMLHSGEILYNAVNGIELGMYKRSPGAPQANIFGFRYDFRFYSLQLFGGVLIFWSARIALAAVRIARGSNTAHSAAWRNIAYVSLLVAPIVPMHIFAVATTVIMVLGAAGLLIAGRRVPVVVQRRELQLVPAE